DLGARCPHAPVTTPPLRVRMTPRSPSGRDPAVAGLTRSERMCPNDCTQPCGAPQRGAQRADLEPSRAAGAQPDPCQPNLQPRPPGPAVIRSPLPGLRGGRRNRRPPREPVGPAGIEPATKGL